MINRKLTAEQIAHRMYAIADKARRSGVNLFFMVDCGEHYEFDTTGTPLWTDKAADDFCGIADDLLHEDLTAIDELLEKLENDEALQ